MKIIRYQMVLAGVLLGVVAQVGAVRFIVPLPDDCTNPQLQGPDGQNRFLLTCPKSGKADEAARGPVMGLRQAPRDGAAERVRNEVPREEGETK